uniref:Bifunctional endo-1,4-beta-xylanase xylA n=1 Tax=Solanum tuberosum TaxID=4113 RepID=M1E191_SOLTU
MQCRLQHKGAEESDKEEQKKAGESGQGHQAQNIELQGKSDQNTIAEKNRDNQQQRNGQPDQGQQTQGKAMQLVYIHNETNGQTSKKGELSKQVDNKGKDSQNDQSKAITQHVSTDATQNDKERAKMHYQQNFPRISNNYARYDPNLQTNKSVASQDNYNNNQGNEGQQDNQHHSQAPNKTK